MIGRIVVFALFTALVASEAPNWFKSVSEKQTASQQPPEPQTAVAAAAPAAPVSTTASALNSTGSYHLKANEQGHFVGQFRINGQPVSGLIDTGATYVAINETTARKLGYFSGQLNYQYGVSTANGEIKAAHISLREMAIDNIRVTDVDAFVLKDDALKDTLVGMSFLKKLSSYSVANNTLQLKR